MCSSIGMNKMDNNEGHRTSGKTVRPFGASLCLFTNLLYSVSVFISSNYIKEILCKCCLCYISLGRLVASWFRTAQTVWADLPGIRSQGPEAQSVSVSRRAQACGKHSNSQDLQLIPEIVGWSHNQSPLILQTPSLFFSLIFAGVVLTTISAKVDEWCWHLVTAEGWGAGWRVDTRCLLVLKHAHNAGVGRSMKAPHH